MNRTIKLAHKHTRILYIAAKAKLHIFSATYFFFIHMLPRIDILYRLFVQTCIHTLAISFSLSSITNKQTNRKLCEKKRKATREEKKINESNLNCTQSYKWKWEKESWNGIIKDTYICCIAIFDTIPVIVLFDGACMIRVSCTRTHNANWAIACIMNWWCLQVLYTAQAVSKNECAVVCVYLGRDQFRFLDQNCTNTHTHTQNIEREKN